MNPNSPPPSQAAQEARRRGFRFLFVFITIALIVICGLTVLLIRNALLNDRREPSPVLPGVSVETLAELPGDDVYPEALTLGLDGNIYVSSYCTGDILRVTPDGEVDTYYSGDDIGAASGLAFSPTGALYVVDGRDCNPRRWTATIKRIAPDGETVERVSDVDENDIPNALAFDEDGRLYMTDTQNGTIRRLEDDAFLDWWQSPDNDARLTGLAFDPTTGTFIVADTEYGKLWRVGFDNEGRALEGELLFEREDRALDGISLDEQGRVYVTLFNVNQVALWQAGLGFTILADDFREPSDVLYLDGQVYVTNFDSVSLAPLVGWLLEPSLPFTVDVIDLPDDLVNAPVQED